MGASRFVSSGHFAHSKGWRHRLHRVESNPEESHCGVCSRSVEVTAVVYSCRRCPFVLHESCHSFPKKIKQHFAHPGNGRRHTLKLLKSQPPVAGHMMMCSICDTGFDTGSFVYECARCRRFYAHPLCCRLPETKKIHGHEHPLTLRAPPTTTSWKNNGRARRRCLNAAGTGRCRNAARLDNDRAWTYQCDDCHVELCLACQLPGAAHHLQGNGHGANVAQAVAHDVATAIGTFFRTMCCACLGVQVQPPQPLPKPVS
ncbi:hypothetical protein QOZ80_8AG0638510 [Eleusine coracana subsp. coracana]|nr:hypothetical protein QOZ80_8AG0638510 [Eleusine coracana subsp. coracana]